MSQFKSHTYRGRLEIYSWLELLLKTGTLETRASNAMFLVSHKT